MTGERTLYIAMEFCSGGSLKSIMEALRPHGSFSADQIEVVCKRVLQALQYLSEEGIVHRDIKPDNILINSRGEIKLADFGVSYIKERSSDCPNSTAGTAIYKAPEVGANGEKTTFKADIYSLGVTIIALAQGTWPQPPERSQSARATHDTVSLIRMDFSNKPSARLTQINGSDTVHAVSDAKPFTLTPTRHTTNGRIDRSTNDTLMNSIHMSFSGHGQQINGSSLREAKPRSKRLTQIKDRDTIHAQDGARQRTDRSLDKKARQTNGASSVQKPSTSWLPVTHCSLKPLVEKCLKQDPAKRKTATELLENREIWTLDDDASGEVQVNMAVKVKKMQHGRQEAAERDRKQSMSEAIGSITKSIQMGNDAPVKPVVNALRGAVLERYTSKVARMDQEELEMELERSSR